MFAFCGTVRGRTRSAAGGAPHERQRDDDLKFRVFGGGRRGLGCPRGNKIVRRPPAVFVEFARFGIARGDLLRFHCVRAISRNARRRVYNTYDGRMALGRKKKKNPAPLVTHSENSATYCAPVVPFGEFANGAIYARATQ